MHEGLHHSVSRVIAADPATLYRLISDVTRMGEWSPEARGAKWLGGATGPVAGARFRGRSRWRLVTWYRTCVVEEAEPGKRFVFRTLPTAGIPDSTRWSYELTDIEGGSTRVTESYEIVQAMPRLLQAYVTRPLMPHHLDLRPHMAETLAGLEIGAGLLPGQAAAPPGPTDLIGMYSMHHAFRRDLVSFRAAVTATPVDEWATWDALATRWDRFADILHKHHTGEDEALWPLLRTRALAAGDTAAVTTLDAMEAEHAGIDPLLAAIRSGFDTLARGAAESERAALAQRLGAAVTLLGAHLGHEERDAMALVQRLLAPAEWHRMEQEVFKAAYLPKQMPFMIGWVLKGLSAAGRRRALGSGGPGGPVIRVVAALVGPGFRRKERAAFRFAG